jgi:hypothetical protein
MEKARLHKTEGKEKKLKRKRGGGTDRLPVKTKRQTV